jgi:hypothetical protein
MFNYSRYEGFLAVASRSLGFGNIDFSYFSQRLGITHAALSDG